MLINTNKLPIKYLLNIYQELPNYPTHIDLCYALVFVLEEVNRLSKDFTAKQIWGGMKHHFTNIEDLVVFLDELTNPVDASTSVQLEKKKDGFRLISTPWG
jgi:hypothetical protein